MDVSHQLLVIGDLSAVIQKNVFFQKKKKKQFGLLLIFLHDNGLPHNFFHLVSGTFHLLFQRRSYYMDDAFPIRTGCG